MWIALVMSTGSLIAHAVLLYLLGPTPSIVSTIIIQALIPLTLILTPDSPNAPATLLALSFLHQFSSFLNTLDFIVRPDQLLWRVSTVLMGLAAGLAVLREGEEAGAREHFNRQFASKFFSSSSAFIL